MIFDRCKLDEKDYRIIPITWQPSKFYTITFDGWNKFILDITDPIFMDLNVMAEETLRTFCNLYKNDFAFTQPQFYIKSDGTFTIKIGTLKNEYYDNLMNKKGIKHENE